MTCVAGWRVGLWRSWQRWTCRVNGARGRSWEGPPPGRAGRGVLGIPARGRRLTSHRPGVRTRFEAVLAVPRAGRRRMAGCHHGVVRPVPPLAGDGPAAGGDSSSPTPRRCGRGRPWTPGRRRFCRSTGSSTTFMTNRPPCACTELRVAVAAAAATRRRWSTCAGTGRRRCDRCSGRGARLLVKLQSSYQSKSKRCWTPAPP